MAIVQPLKCYKYTRALHFNFCEIIRFYGGWQLLLHVAIGNRRINIFTKYDTLIMWSYAQLCQRKKLLL